VISPRTNAASFRNVKRLLVPILLIGAMWGRGGEARAIEYLVESRTLGDAYQLVTSGNTLLNRWQVHQLLGLSLWESPDEDGRQHWSFTSLFRFDIDFGITEEELRDVPTLNRSLPSIQYAWVDGKELLGGAVDLRIGRQLMTDAMDYLMLDGAKVQVKLPFHLGIEVHGGFEVKQDFGVLAATQLELDGVRVISGIEEDDRLVTVIGAALVTRDLQFANYRLGYRRRFSGGAVDSEHLGLSAHQRIVEGLDVSGVANWDLFNGRFERLQATARWRPADFTEVELQYLRLLPSFDADSIFNIFTAFPLNDGNLRWRLYPSEHDRVYLGGMVRFFGNESYAEGTLTAPVDTIVEAWGGMAGWLHTFGPKGRDGRVSVDVAWQDGYGGRRILGDAMGVWSIVPREWEVEGRLTAVDYDDAVKPERSTFSMGYQLGARYLIERQAAFALIFEHNMNAIQDHQVRLYAMVDLNLWL
jgi:hypothetical protein